MDQIVTIERLSYGPDAIAHSANGKTVFVAGGVPGDVCEIEVVKAGERYDKARVSRVIEPSPVRVDNPYQALALENLPWANVAYEQQLLAKRGNVVDALVRIGKMDAAAAEELVAPAVPSEKPWRYRNKVELTVGTVNGKAVVGSATANGSIVKLDDDPLLDAAGKGVVKAVSGALGFLMGSKSIDIDRVGIRCSARTGELEVALWGPPGPFPRAHAAKVIGDALKGRASSIVRVMHKGPRAARKIAGVEALAGKGSWAERIGDETMRVSAPSFFQVNTKGAEKLVELVLAGLEPREDDEAMDLYCGAGTFTLPLARRCSFVSAVESYGPAVRDLRRNLELAGADNVDAAGGDAAREFPCTDADIIVVDPPRAGLDEQVVEQLSAQPARAIAYVSCDPATLARDLARFERIGAFTPSRITPVDLFPQTFHIETVALMTK